jgi:programmed cell death protein 5
MSDDPELDEIRKRKQLELQKQLEEQEQQKEIKAQIDVQRQRILINILTDQARERLNNIKLANQEFATSLENQLIQLSQSGRIKAKITDDQLKVMLRQIQGQSKTDKKITIKRK